ncbi:patatin-like phospholipase family protein [Haliovirga abyssi]|uniref:Esterase n=1 Tax=Haliovirga abyssi TaxID=2996794 RepID=A0AAU9DU33_9FUSO|nr:patatin-like phospholipase family protein [Haliovirga abyssi]BDU50739.1 esterase [Haliovirga abyssi]
MKESRKKLGLVLSGGSAWGLSHIGVIKRLEEEGIKPDLIVGSSIGSIIGSLYAIGMPIKYIEGIASNFNYSLLLDFTKERKNGLLKGKYAEEFIKILTRGRNFSDCKIPFYINATDFLTGEEVIISSGKLYKGVRASISIPLIFKPVKRGGRYLTDGGVYDPLPIHIAKKYGAEKIIAIGFRDKINKDDKVVDEELLKDGEELILNPGKIFIDEIANNEILKTILKKSKFSLTKNEGIKEKILVIENFLNILFMGDLKRTEREADIFLKPDVLKYMQLNFFKGEKIIEEGYKEADKNIDEIKKLII